MSDTLITGLLLPDDSLVRGVAGPKNMAERG